MSNSDGDGVAFQITSLPHAYIIIQTSCSQFDGKGSPIKRNSNFSISAMMPKSAAAKYAEKHPDTATVLPNGKLQFIATGMDFPATVTNEVIQAYVNGKAYRRACARKKNQDYDFTQHLPYIVPHKHKDEKHFLYCTLTNVTLPRDFKVVETHVNAKKFKRMLEEARLAKEQKKTSADKRKKRKQEKSADGNNENMKDVEEGKDAEEKEDDGDENEQGDVLDGILSDDSEDENAESGEDNEGDTNEKVVEMRIEEDEEMEDTDVFWTRGNQSSHAAEDGDTDDEWGASTETPSVNVTKVKKVVEKKKASKAETITVTGKRDRKGDSATIPKKIRQVRRRRKSNTATET